MTKLRRALAQEKAAKDAALLRVSERDRQLDALRAPLLALLKDEIEAIARSEADYAVDDIRVTR